MSYQYVLKEKLGEGGFADVFRAIRSDTNAEVAIKMLRDAANADARHRFKREVRQLNNLRHRRIIDILDFNLEADRPWYAMPIMKGGALTRWAGKLPVETVRCIMREMAEALAFVHASGGIHRDIKPDNLLVDAAGQIAVGDFGLGNHPRYTVIFTQSAAGTPGYAAPEVMGPFGYATQASDMYSLGATIFHLLTGVHPSAVTNFNSLLLRTDIPTDLRALVVNLTRHAPQERLTAIKLLIALGGPKPAEYRAIPAPPAAVGPSSDALKSLIAIAAISLVLVVIVGAASKA